MEASGHRGKISGVWEDPILFRFLLFQNKEEKLFPVGTTRGTLAIHVSNEPPKGRDHKSIFAHLPSSLPLQQIRKLASNLEDENLIK